MTCRPYHLYLVTPEGVKIPLGAGYLSPSAQAAGLEVWRERLARAEGHRFTLEKPK